MRFNTKEDNNVMLFDPELIPVLCCFFLFQIFNNKHGDIYLYTKKLIWDYHD